MSAPLYVEREGGGALFSPGRVFRYALWRQWNDSAQPRTATFIGLNPSTADETADDPTIRRCIGFAKGWGCSGLVMLNLFALRATDPRIIPMHSDPIGPENDEALRNWTTHSAIVVAAWGVHGVHRDRAQTVRRHLAINGCRLDCLGLTRDGHPRHPLYLRADTTLIPWSYSGGN